MRILHPTDFSRGAAPAEAEAVRLVRALGGELILLHVSVERPRPRHGPAMVGGAADAEAAERKRATEWLDAKVRRLCHDGIDARWNHCVGFPSEEIVEVAVAEGVDQIVMGTHGRGGPTRLLLGSVADTVIRLAPCPVLTVREQPVPAAA